MKTPRPSRATLALLACFLCLLPCASLAHAQEELPQVDGSVSRGNLIRRPAPATPSVMAAPEDLTKARLGPGYLLQMEVYDTPEMDATLRVDSTGNVSVPLVGPVHVEGLTLLEAQQAIEQALKTGEILKVPQVTLNVLQFASGSVTVLGEVQAPGRVPMLAPRTLGEVLAAAGGETFSAGSEIEIQHTSSASKLSVQHVHYSSSMPSDELQHTMVYPGDTVVVNRAGAVYVLGGVTRPGAYLMLNGGSLNLLEAISLAQGTLLRAKVSTVEILRPTGESYARLSVPLKDMQRGKVSPTRLQVNDIVYVPISVTKSVFIDGGALLGAAATASVYSIR